MNLQDLQNEMAKYQNQFQIDDALDVIRKKALKRLVNNSFPTRKTESWKYTSLKNIQQTEFVFGSDKSSNNEKLPRPADFLCLYFINGKLHELSDDTQFKISKLGNASAEIITKNQEAFQNDFAQNLNESMLQDGMHFELPADIHVKKPIIIYHINNHEQAILRSQRNTFSIGQNSKVTVLEVYHGPSQSGSLYNFASDIYVEKNAQFCHLHHQILKQTENFFNNVRVQVEQDACYQSFTINIGSKLGRTNLHIDLNAPGANCLAHGIYTLQDEQHNDVYSLINHHAPHTQSDQLYKGIMNNKSRGVFTGLIKVFKNAQQVNSSQLNKNLILSKGAQVNSRPQLEIFADDVKCSHGSTTGQLNEDELFYFESRGIRPAKARSMLSHAFTYDVLLKIEDQAVRTFIQKDIADIFEKKAFGENHV